MASSLLLDTLYDAALDPAAWSRIAPDLAASFGCESAQISVWGTHRVTERLTTTVNYDQEANRTYKAHYYKIDEWVKLASRVPEGIVSITSELISDDEFEQTEHYNDYCKRLGIFYCMGLVIPLGGGESASIGVHRPRSRPFTSQRDRARLGRLAQHVRRALQIRQRLVSADALRASALVALDRLAFGVIAVTADLRLIFANKAAELLLADQSSGLGWRMGRLCLKDSKLASLLAAAVRGASLTGAGKEEVTGADLLVQRPSPASPLWLQVFPLSARAASMGINEPSALILAHNHDTLSADAVVSGIMSLRSLYHLTPAEARLAMALLDGERLAQFVDRTAITMNTVKTQLRQVFAKLDCNNQADLVRVLQPLRIGR